MLRRLTPSQLERLITYRFEELGDTNLVSDVATSDDFELQALAASGLGEVRGKRVLDVGCGKGRLSRVLRDWGANVVGIDPVPRFLQVASINARGAHFVLGTVTRLPFLDGAFDSLICVEVLEHVPDVEAAIKEMSRVLKIGGVALILDKNLVGVGIRGFFPNFVWKLVMEWLGKWMYPRGFPFRERWFIPGVFARKLRRSFSAVELHYLPGRAHKQSIILSSLLRILPFLCPDVAWCCRK
jgi:2-polyprenyl-3-methyl-5-hydroxy-6-metoxy-1,4-benzoquinol methylase